MASDEGDPIDDAATQFQRQLLGAIEATQLATSSFVNAWFQGATQVATAFADLTQPAPDVPLEPNQLMAFMSELFAAQQSFITDQIAQADPMSFL